MTTINVKELINELIKEVSELSEVIRTGRSNIHFLNAKKELELSKIALEKGDNDDYFKHKEKATKLVAKGEKELARAEKDGKVANS